MSRHAIETRDALVTIHDEVNGSLQMLGEKLEQIRGLSEKDGFIRRHAGTNLVEICYRLVLSILTRAVRVDYLMRVQPVFDDVLQQASARIPNGRQAIISHELANRIRDEWSVETVVDIASKFDEELRLYSNLVVFVADALEDAA